MPVPGTCQPRGDYLLSTSELCYERRLMLSSLMEKLASTEYCDLLDRILCAIPEHVFAVDASGSILYTNLALANAWRERSCI